MSTIELRTTPPDVPAEKLHGTVSLDDRAVLRVQGEEAHDFLQRILTADIPQPGAGEAVLAALCNAKGRVHGLFHVVPPAAGETEFWLVLPADIATGVTRKLMMYVLRSRVTVERGTDLQVLGALGKGLAGRLDEVVAGTSSLEPGGAGVDTASGLRTVRLNDALPELPRYLVLGPAAAGAVPHTTAAPALDSAAWRLGMVLAGEPDVRAPNQDRFIAQMIDLDRLGGVSFAKGCFPGQEVIARTHYRGTVKQRMAWIRGEGDPPPDGTEVRTGEGKLAGHVVHATGDESGAGFRGLASVRMEMVEGAGALHLAAGEADV